MSETQDKVTIRQQGSTLTLNGNIKDFEDCSVEFPIDAENEVEIKKALADGFAWGSVYLHPDIQLGSICLDRENGDYAVTVVDMALSLRDRALGKVASAATDLDELAKKEEDPEVAKKLQRVSEDLTAIWHKIGLASFKMHQNWEINTDGTK